MGSATTSRVFSSRELSGRRCRRAHHSSRRRKCMPDIYSMFFFSSSSVYVMYRVDSLRHQVVHIPRIASTLLCLCVRCHYNVMRRETPPLLVTHADRQHQRGSLWARPRGCPPAPTTVTRTRQRGVRQRCVRPGRT